MGTVSRLSLYPSAFNSYLDGKRELHNRHCSRSCRQCATLSIGSAGVYRFTHRSARVQIVSRVCFDVAVSVADAPLIGLVEHVRAAQRFPPPAVARATRLAAGVTQQQ